MKKTSISVYAIYAPPGSRPEIERLLGGKDTGWRSAVIYTFVEQVRAQRADPFRYLEWLFTQLMHHPHPTGAQLDALMPAAWLQLHSSSCIAPAAKSHSCQS